MRCRDRPIEYRFYDAVWKTAQVLGKIFDPFYTAKPVSKGTGLGLSIGYGIVERHGGQLSAGNAPEGGAQFRLCLPQSRR